MSRFTFNLFLMGLLLSVGLTCPAETPSSSNPNFFVPNGLTPDGKKPKTPLEHLAFDRKVTTLLQGDRQGETEGSYWVAHRFIDDIGGSGYGWIRKSDENWKSAKWCCLRETPGKIVAPHRRFLKTGMDVDFEYKFWGKFADYTAYDPRTDEHLPVFILYGYEVIGLASPLKLKVGTPERVNYTRPSTASSRSDRPIGNPDFD